MRREHADGVRSACKAHQGASLCMAAWRGGQPVALADLKRGKSSPRIKPVHQKPEASAARKRVIALYAEDGSGNMPVYYTQIV